MIERADKQSRAKAQNALGEMYLYGSSVIKNEATAVFLFVEAAKQNIPEAQNHLGVMCARIGELKLAEVLFLLAARKGLPVARYNLRLMRAKGDAVGKNGAKAEKMLEDAAYEGFADAQYLLGLIKEFPDLQCLNAEMKGEKYLHRATIRENSEKILTQGGIQEAKNVGENTATHNATIEHQGALEWYKYAAEQGHFKARQKIREFADPDKKDDADAQYYLGRLYEYGIGIERSAESAIKWYKKAATFPRENSKAQFSLGRMYARGTGVEQDKERALEYYRWAAAHWHTETHFSLGQMYYRGDGVEKHLGTASYHFSTAARFSKDEKIRNASLMAKEQIKEDRTE